MNKLRLETLKKEVKSLEKELEDISDDQSLHEQKQN